MAFGIPGSEPNAGGQYLSRIQYDARVGFWQIVKRVQDGAGNWVDDKTEPFKNPTMLFDMGSLEVGYIKLTSPPAFLVVPYGKPIPPQPQEMMTDAQGKQRKSYLPGFRVKVMSSKTFGDAEAYYFSNNSKTVMEPMDELYQIFEQAPEAAAGKVPLVAVTGTKVVENKNPQGTSRFYAPVFQIVQWLDRPAVLGDRTVPVPTQRSAASQPIVTAPVTASPAPVQQAPVMPPPVAHVAAAGVAAMPDF
jgi:hypothetical protein